MIRFTNIKELKDVLNSLSISTLSEQANPFECIKIEQIRADCTALTTVNINKGYYTRYIYHTSTDSGGDPGKEILVSFISLKEAVTRIANTSTANITFKINKANLKIYGDLCVLSTGKESYKFCCNVPRFAEFEDQFKVDDIHSTIYEEDGLIGEINGRNFDLLIRAASGFCNPTASSSDIILLEKEGYKYKLYCTYIRGLLEATVVELSQVDDINRAEVHLPVTALKSLKKLFLVNSEYTDIEIYQKGGWAGFKSEGGKVSIKTSDIIDNYTRKCKEAYFSEKADQEYQVQCSRSSISLQDFSEALEISSPDKDDLTSQTFISELVEEDVVLQIRSANQISFEDDEHYNVKVSYLGRQGEWYSTIYNYPTLDKAVKLLKRVELGEEEREPSISLVLRYRKRDKENTLYRLDLKPEHTYQNYKLCLSLTGKDGYDFLEGLTL